MAGTSSASSPDCDQPRVSVWLARQPLEPQASPDWFTSYEQEVAASFATGRFNEFVHSRWLIRQALHGVSGFAPHRCRPVHGRPVASAEPEGWNISLSHSHGMAACALSDSPGIGVDIEPLYRDSSWHRIVRRWFTVNEQNWLLSQTDEAAFLRAWTLKEAWLKATGRGIANNLKSLEVLADGTLIGDRPGENWQAAITEADSYVVAVVWQQDTEADTPPDLHLVTADEHHDIAPAHPEPVGELDWQVRPVVSAGTAAGSESA